MTPPLPSLKDVPHPDRITPKSGRKPRTPGVDRTHNIGSDVERQSQNGSVRGRTFFLCWTHFNPDLASLYLDLYSRWGCLKHYV